MFFVVFYALIAQHNFDNLPSTIYCAKASSQLVKTIFARLNASKSLNMNQPICEYIDQVNKLNEQDLFITNGYSRGTNIVCVSDALDNPCKIKIGSFSSSVSNPRSVLTSIFDYKEEVNLLSPINESIERLLIRPAEFIDIKQLEETND